MRGKSLKRIPRVPSQQCDEGRAESAPSLTPKTVAPCFDLLVVKVTSMAH